ncbi:hypothetical protein BBJ28_00017291 [Nothophytophthora sp. Chile5]|nr:hypothetical protein BBJ28_00017291 [Nothophytophthora sp. Chile5]
MGKLANELGVSAHGDLRVALDREKYTTGDLVQGRVLLRVGKRVQSSDFVIRLEGKERISFRLPESLPGSFHINDRQVVDMGGIESSISYKIRVVMRIDGALKADLEASSQLTIQRSPLSLPVKTLERSSSAKVRVLRLFSRGRCTLSASLDHEVTVAGDTLTVFTSVRNQSSRVMTGLSVRLIEDLAVDVPFRTQKRGSTVVCRRDYPGVKCGRHADRALSLDLVAETPSSLEPINPTMSCHFVQWQYRLLVKCSFRLCPSVTVEFPVVVSSSLATARMRLARRSGPFSSPVGVEDVPLGPRSMPTRSSCGSFYFRAHVCFYPALSVSSDPSMNLRAFFVAAAASFAYVQADVISHDAVVPFAQPTPTTTEQTAGIKFKPQIHISNGCHPYPAVDEDGNTSGGLKPTGSASAGCKGSGYGSQVYGRITTYEGVYAIMYSWYMPKDSPISGLGHRHDWEHVVVWVDDITLASPTIVAVSPSAHSGYNIYYPPDSDTLDGYSAKVDYSSSWLVVNHALDSTSDAGETQDLIMWDQLTDAARTALEDTDFGDANVPMKDANFETKLGNAYYA